MNSDSMHRMNEIQSLTRFLVLSKVREITEVSFAPSPCPLPNGDRAVLFTLPREGRTCRRPGRARFRTLPGPESPTLPLRERVKWCKNQRFLDLYKLHDFNVARELGTVISRTLLRMLVAFVLLLFSSPSRASATDSQLTYERTVVPFLKQHCTACHDEREERAGLRLDTLGTDFLTGKRADVWAEVMNVINSGEMPPKDEVELIPDPQQAFDVVQWIDRELKESERAARMAGGRILSRRLNRSEYTNTVRDLLLLDENFMKLIEEDLPGDGKSEGLDRIGSALLFDEVQLSTYIELAQRIAEKTIVASETAPKSNVKVVQFEQQWRPSKGEHEVIQYQKDTIIPAGPDPAVRKETGVEFLQPIVYGRKTEFGVFGGTYDRFMEQNSVPVDGYYRLRIKAGAFLGDRGTPIRIQFTYLPNTPLETVGELKVRGTLDEPEVIETVVFLRKPPEGSNPRMALKWNGYTDAIIQHPDLTSVSNRRNRATGDLQKLAGAGAPQAEIDAAKAEVEARIADARAFSKQKDAVARIYNPQYDLPTIPRIFVDWVEFEGPIERDWPPASHVALFPDGVRDDLQSGDLNQSRQLFAKLLPRAYRRPVSDAEVEAMVSVGREGRQRFGLNQVDAMRFALQTLLSSPDFLLLFEPSSPDAPPRRLTGHELATRLSYFLWSTMPDEELFELAASQRIHEPEVLAAQVERMIASPKARSFVENFAGQWLHVRDYPSVQPANDYRDYDAELKLASLEEPYAFFDEVLREDLSILNFLDSDFAMLNERLAKHYQIDGVSGAEFQRVALTPQHHRGGVLTMAGLLTYLSDGTRTLPVRRGAWILEQIFQNPPPPPPPNAGEIQPNASGKNLTVRERLELHRSEATCASCHAKIDPLGLALENYDAIGAWRTHQNGEGFRNPARAPLIDASGALPSGRSFETPAEFKQALMDEKERFAAALTHQLLTYALCRPVGYPDRAAVQQISGRLAQSDYRIQTLIQSIVASELFQTK